MSVQLGLTFVSANVVSKDMPIWMPWETVAGKFELIFSLLVRIFRLGDDLNMRSGSLRFLEFPSASPPTRFIN